MENFFQIILKIMATKTEIFNKENLKQDLFDIRVGDTVKVYQKIKQIEKKHNKDDALLIVTHRPIIRMIYILSETERNILDSIPNGKISVFLLHNNILKHEKLEVSQTSKVIILQRRTGVESLLMCK